VNEAAKEEFPMRTIRTSTTRQGKAVAVVMAALLGLQTTAIAGQTAPAAASPRQPPPYRTLASILADIQDASAAGRPDDQLSDAAPPNRPPRTLPLWSAMASTAKTMQATLVRLLATRTGPFRQPAIESLQFAVEGLTDLVQVETDFAGALNNLKLSVDRLRQAQLLVPADPEALQFTKAYQTIFALFGAQLAREGIVRARHGGVDEGRIGPAEDALGRGLAAIQAGQYVLALDNFGPGIIVGNLPFFSLDLYEQNIKDAFENEVIGYQYAIARNGQLMRTGAAGLARTSTDGPQTAQSATKEMNIASTSKTITATVLIQLLEDRGVSVDSSISPWLPASWVKGPGINQLTFRDLLTHQSGLNHNNGGNYDLDSLRSYIQLGVVAAEKATYKYQNGNFALFRVAIPYLRYGAAGVDLLAAIWGLFGSFEEVIAGLYIGTVYDYALNPTGVIQAKCKPNDAKQTLLYRFPDDGSEGFQNGDWTLLCGSGGWYMSSVELAGFMAFRRFSNVMMTPTARNLMDNGFLGWMSGGNYDWPNGEHGLYRSHGGDLFYDPEPRRGLDACIIEYPNGVQTAILINSNGGSYSYQCAELATAFDNAWITP